MAIFDVTYLSTKDSMNESAINEFFHQQEIDCLNLCHEFQINRLLEQYGNINLNEAGITSNSIKVFISRLKEKIISFFQKISQAFTALQVKIAAKKEHKLFDKSKLSTIDDDYIEEIIDKYINDKKSTCYYDISEAMSTANEGIVGMINSFLDDDTESMTSSESESVKSVQEIMAVYAYDPDEAVDTIKVEIMNSDNNTLIKNELSLCKKCRDSGLKECDAVYNMMGKLGVQSSKEYTNGCSYYMNLYMATLKMILENCKTRINIINLITTTTRVEDSNNK